MTTIVRPRDVGRPTLIAPGSSAPIGPTVVAGGVNFCVWSRHATGLDLPTPGCWRLRLTSGELRASVDIQAVRLAR